MPGLPDSTRPPGEHHPLENLADVPKTIAVLAASPFVEDHTALRGIFSHSSWRLYSAQTFQQAVALLAGNPVGVVLTECAFPDGRSWTDLLSEIRKQPNPPMLIVASRLADDSLWAEVLNLGGYDLLVKPFDATEVFRVVSLAWLSWKHRPEQAAAALRKSPQSSEATRSSVMKAGYR